MVQQKSYQHLKLAHVEPESQFNKRAFKQKIQFKKDYFGCLAVFGQIGCVNSLWNNYFNIESI